MRARVNRGLTIILVTALLYCLVIFTRRSGSKSDDLSNISWSSFKMSLPESPSFLNFIRDAGDIDDVPEQPHHHYDLYDRDLTVINITKFKFLINNDICNVSKIHMVSIIHTAGPNVDARQMIRWVKDCSCTHPAKLKAEIKKYKYFQRVLGSSQHPWSSDETCLSSWFNLRLRSSDVDYRGEWEESWYSSGRLCRSLQEPLLQSHNGQALGIRVLWTGKWFLNQDQEDASFQYS